MNIENQLARFWEIEECASDEKVRTSEEQLCEESFVKYVKRKKDGRFVVKIPLKGDPHGLGDSKPSAKHRFLKLKAKLSKNPELREEYHKFIREYIELGHMKEAEEKMKSDPSYYFPHH